MILEDQTKLPYRPSHLCPNASLRRVKRCIARAGYRVCGELLIFPESAIRHTLSSAEIAGMT
jgi:hypothetical protein